MATPLSPPIRQTACLIAASSRPPPAFGGFFRYRLCEARQVGVSLLGPDLARGSTISSATPHPLPFTPPWLLFPCLTIVTLSAPKYKYPLPYEVQLRRRDHLHPDPRERNPARVASLSGPSRLPLPPFPSQSTGASSRICKQQSPLPPLPCSPLPPPTHPLAIV